MHGAQTLVFGRQFLDNVEKESVNYEKTLFTQG